MAEIFHTLNRGVDKRKIFMDEQDYFRFIHDLFEFNDQNPLNNSTYRFRQQSKVIARPYIEKQPRKLLVNIHAFCIMPNHYHLLLSPKVEGGITKFMKKLNMGYARYFNEKYKRSGALFQGRYKSIVIEKDAHFIHLPYYIHLNPLDLIAPEWRDRKISNLNNAIKFLDSYRWSSHLDYAGKKNFPSVTQREFLMEFFGGSQNYNKTIYQWLKDLNISEIEEKLLE